MPITNTTTYGLPKGYSRATFVIKSEILEQLRSVSYWERIAMKEIVENALVGYLHEQPERIKRSPAR